MLKINRMLPFSSFSRVLLAAGLLGGASLSVLGAGSAKADDSFICGLGGATSISLSYQGQCNTVDWTAGWSKGDKVFKLTDFAQLDANPPSGLLSFIYNDFGPVGVSPEDTYNVLTSFFPNIAPPSSGSYAYTLAIDPVLGAGYTFDSVELDVNHSGTGQVVTKAVTGVPDLVSTNGVPVGPVSFPGGLTSIAVRDSWVLDPNTGDISSISNTFNQKKSSVPGPLPLLGAGAAFGFSRRIRSRIKGARLV
jgi:hypothetical protein